MNLMDILRKQESLLVETLNDDVDVKIDPEGTKNTGDWYNNKNKIDDRYSGIHDQATQPKTHDLDDTLTSVPYKEKECISRVKYHIKSCFVTHPRLLSLFLLYRSTWPRILALLDVFTDIQVTIDLYQADERYLMLFSLSLLFISFSFIILWSVSLRFIDTFLQKTKTNSCSTITHACVVLYLFPPFGCILISLYELYHVFYDIYLGFYSFFKGEILIIDKKNSKKTAFKQFRRIVEFFGESIPQLMLQTYMFYAKISVESFDLILSMCISSFHLLYNLYKLNQEAKFHGMSFVQYSISVLHLGMSFAFILFLRLLVCIGSSAIALNAAIALNPVTHAPLYYFALKIKITQDLILVF